MDPLPDPLDPPVPEDELGRVRRVGVEIELTQLDVEAIAATVAEVFGGAVTRETDYLSRVDTDLGTFRVEADLALLQRIGRAREEGGDQGALATAARDALASLAEMVAPFEVVSPPVPYPSLPMLDDLVAALRARGGQGTRGGLLQALALQLNPQVPSEEPASIHAHLRAYAALEPWLRVRHNVDVTRNILPFVDAYPVAYAERLLERQSPPGLAELVDEYLRYNPTRNRSLDMLPLFSLLDPLRVAAVVADDRIHPRPTYHYRLPDSRVGEERWRVTDEWRHWLVVERVAASPPLLEELARGYLDTLRGRSGSTMQASWPPRCEQILQRWRYGLGAAGAGEEPRPAA